MRVAAVPPGVPAAPVRARRVRGRRVRAAKRRWLMPESSRIRLIADPTERWSSTVSRYARCVERVLRPMASVTSGR